MSDAHQAFDPATAGAYLGGTKPLSRQALAIHRLKGTGPRYYKLGRLVRYRREDLDAWIAGRMRSNTSQTA
jgi:hypothetical protein